MNRVRLAVSVSGLTLAASGCLVALGSASATAEECKGLLSCTTEDVGKTVDSASKGDLEGTVDGAGKTVGGTLDRAGKTLTGKGDDEQPGGSTPPAGGGSSAGTGGNDDESGAPHSASRPKPKQPKTHRQRTASEAAAGGGSAAVGGPGLQPWRQTNRLHPDGAWLSYGDRPVQPPQVAAPPVTGPRTPVTNAKEENKPVTNPVAKTRTTQQQAPPATVFLATTMAGTVGISVLCHCGRRRRSSTK